QPLDLGAGPAEDEDEPPARSDELLLDADRLAVQDQPVQPQAVGRRRGLVAGGDGGGSSGGGSTLFERMANLSRGSSVSDDEEEDEDEEDGKDGSSLSIPRFLGRQNNQ
ncbi:MAG: cell division protein FtsZ, partial [Novosphingobium meiothermophilum]